MALGRVNIFHGQGESFAPDPIHLDRLICRRYAARGLAGKRDDRHCLYVSTDREQARGYAKDGKEEHLFSVMPKPGTTITWIPGIADLILEFEAFLRDCWLAGQYHFQGKTSKPLLEDTRGNVDTIDYYLKIGRQKPAVSRMIDTFLDEHPPMEITFQSVKDLTKIGDHKGELTLVGKWDLLPA